MKVHSAFFVFTIFKMQQTGAFDNPYDFGLFENELMLKSLLKEDQEFQHKIEKIAQQSESIKRFVDLQKIVQVYFYQLYLRYTYINVIFVCFFISD